MILLLLLDFCATKKRVAGGRPHDKYVKDERRKGKSHDENDENEDDETILIPSIYHQQNAGCVAAIWMYGCIITSAGCFVNNCFEE